MAGHITMCEHARLAVHVQVFLRSPSAFLGCVRSAEKTNSKDISPHLSPPRSSFHRVRFPQVQYYSISPVTSSPLHVRHQHIMSANDDFAPASNSAACRLLSCTSGAIHLAFEFPCSAGILRRKLNRSDLRKAAESVPRFSSPPPLPSSLNHTRARRQSRRRRDARLPNRFYLVHTLKMERIRQPHLRPAHMQLYASTPYQPLCSAVCSLGNSMKHANPSM
jgi:hypothetical protein